MRWPWRRGPVASPDAEEASQQAERALLDAKNFDRRADVVARRLAETHRRNHIAEAVMAAIIRGKA